MIEDIEDADVVKESNKAGELCLLEWHGDVRIVVYMKVLLLKGS